MPNDQLRSLPLTPDFLIRAQELMYDELAWLENQRVSVRRLDTYLKGDQEQGDGKYRNVRLDVGRTPFKVGEQLMQSIDHPAGVESDDVYWVRANLNFTALKDLSQSSGLNLTNEEAKVLFYFSNFVGDDHRYFMQGGYTCGVSPSLWLQLFGIVVEGTTSTITGMQDTNNRRTKLVLTNHVKRHDRTGNIELSLHYECHIRPAGEGESQEYIANYSNEYQCEVSQSIFDELIEKASTLETLSAVEIVKRIPLLSNDRVRNRFLGRLFSSSNLRFLSATPALIGDCFSQEPDTLRAIANDSRWDDYFLNHLPNILSEYYWGQESDKETASNQMEMIALYLLNVARLKVMTTVRMSDYKDFDAYKSAFVEKTNVCIINILKRIPLNTMTLHDLNQLFSHVETWEFRQSPTVSSSQHMASLTFQALFVEEIEHEIQQRQQAVHDILNNLIDILEQAKSMIPIQFDPMSENLQQHCLDCFNEQLTRLISQITEINNGSTHITSAELKHIENLCNDFITTSNNDVERYLSSPLLREILRWLSDNFKILFGKHIDDLGKSRLSEKGLIKHTQSKARHAMKKHLPHAHRVFSPKNSIKSDSCMNNDRSHRKKRRRFGS